jgi:hypothetical protein
MDYALTRCQTNERDGNSSQASIEIAKASYKHLKRKVIPNGQRRSERGYEGISLPVTGQLIERCLLHQKIHNRDKSCEDQASGPMGQIKRQYKLHPFYPLQQAILYLNEKKKATR